MNEHFYTTNAAERDTAASGRYVTEGIAAFVFPGPEAGAIKWNRALNPKTGDHFYTANEAEYNNALNTFGYTPEGTAGYIYPNNIAGTVPFFRLYNPANSKHFYTTSVAERANALTIGFTDEGITGYVSAGQANGFAPLFRSMLPKNGDHFYTMDLAEHNNSITSFGYVNEGIACYLKTSSGTSTAPLYRCVSTNSGDHFYTTNQAERDNAITNLGYKSEGVACYVRTTQIAQNGLTPFYRLYSATADDHFYTTNAGERDNAIANFGYVSEGIACYVYVNQVAGSIPFFRLFQQFDRFVSLNLIAVAGDTWSPAEWNVLLAGFEGAAQLYRQVGIRLNRAGLFQIPAADAGGYATIDSNDEADDLTHDFSVPNDAVDIFCVPVYVGPVAGLSPVGGPCDKNDSKRMNGAVIERLSIANVSIAHELGHYLGLEHRNDTTNIMNPTIDQNTALFTSDQGSTMKGHCFIHSF